MNWFMSAITLGVGSLVAPAIAGDPVLPDWTQSQFGTSSAVSVHPYYPLAPGTFSVMEGIVEDGAAERIETFVTFDTKTILGVSTRVVRDTTFIDDLVVEVAHDWYAQSNDGIVWYFGEFVENFYYDENGKLVATDNAGSWIADGVTNLPGAIMLAQPTEGDVYFQEFAPGVALDFAVVLGLDETVTLPIGTFRDVLETSEGNLIDGPQVVEDKLYAPGIGLVFINTLDDRGREEFTIELVSHTPPLAALDDWTQATFGPSSAGSGHPNFPLAPGSFRVYEGVVEEGVVERIEVFVTFETKTILGVETRVVRDNAFEDGVLVETALDWYATAEDGTVWYFGEFVENYHYDARGSLIAIDNNGSWIADGIATLPGVVMRADPNVGDAYFQEFAPGLAFDFAIVTQVDATVVTPAGRFENVLKTAEGNYFDGPGIAENKLYADAVGLVMVEVLGDAGRTEFEVPLVSIDPVLCMGDVDHDQAVDAADLAVLLGAWGGGDQFADLDRDGEVNQADLAILLSRWGNCR